jgi:hypothetical protein
LLLIEALTRNIEVLVEGLKEHPDVDEAALEGIPGQLREIRSRLDLLHCQRGARASFTFL